MYAGGIKVNHLYKGKIMAATALMSLIVLVTGCQGDATIDNIENKISESVNDSISRTKKQVSDELKNTFANEMKEFITNNELATTLGLSPEEQESITDSIRSYIDNYESDEEQLKAAQESVEEFLENAKGLSAEEIKRNIADLFEASEQN